MSDLLHLLTTAYAPTGGRSGSALCLLWEEAADIAGEGWTAAFDLELT
jgi:hypothetical protein